MENQKNDQLLNLPTQNDDQKFSIELAANSIELKSVFDTLENLDKLESSPVNIATQYFDFQLNKPERFVFIGITQIPNEAGEEMNAVVLIDKAKNTFSNMGTILVSTFIDQNILIGTPVEITWIGTKKTQSGGQVRLWSVFPLSKAVSK